MVHGFILISYRASSILVMVDLFLQELCPLITYKIRFLAFFSAMDRDIEMKFGTQLHLDKFQSKFEFGHD